MSRVAGKVVLVTGGAGGLGQAIAQRLAENGAQVVITDRDEEAVAAVASTLCARGLPVTGKRHDVASETAWEQITAETVSSFGSLDVVVNNAGIVGSPAAAFEQIELEDWRNVMRINQDGVFLGTRAAIRAMKDGNGGSIINIGSMAAFVGTPGGAAYGTSKGSLRTMTKHAAASCARQGLKIRVNCIHPCLIWTPLISGMAEKQFGADGARSAMAERHPFGRLGEPDDVAWAVVYLASEESKLMTGSDLIIDGGALAV